MEIDWGKVAELAGQNLSQTEICLLMEIDEAELRESEEQAARMLKSIRIGKIQKALLIAEKLEEQCEKGNVSALTWWEKTRRGLAESARGENEFESAIAAATEKLARTIARLAGTEEEDGSLGT
jgi:hypothetical protein